MISYYLVTRENSPYDTFSSKKKVDEFLAKDHPLIRVGYKVIEVEKGSQMDIELADQLNDINEARKD